MLFVYEIELPKDADVAAFGAFMREEYVPAIHKRPTRDGVVTGLELLEPDPNQPNQPFLWLVRWEGLRMAGWRLDDDAVRSKFEGFGATMRDKGLWREFASWPTTDVQPD